MVLALESNADLVLLDDLEARVKARKLGLSVTGVLGILLKAKRQGMVLSLKEEVQRLENTGFWISSDLKARFFAHE